MISRLTCPTTSISTVFLKSRPVSFCCTRSSTSSARAFCTSTTSACPFVTFRPLTPSRRDELVRARVRVGGPPVVSTVACAARRSCGRPSRTEGRRPRVACGPAMEVSRSDWKGPGASWLLVRRQVRRGSWMNYSRVSNVYERGDTWRSEMGGKGE